MTKTGYLKGSDAIVLLRLGESGLTLIHAGSGHIERLDGKTARLWSEWKDHGHLLMSQPGLADALLSEGFVIRKALTLTHLPPAACDACVPVLAGIHAKWYCESPDLYVLFNSSCMRKNNPLLILGPYASLCWEGILGGLSVRDIRSRAQQVFGDDEVRSFIGRLIDLGFVAEIPELTEMQMTGALATEFHPPYIQQNIAHAKVPWYCLWEIGSVCDLRCRTCYLPDFTSAGPDADQVNHVIGEIVATDIFYVSIMGGEPLLRYDLEEIVRELRRHGVFVKVITNGQGLTRDRACRLTKAGLNQVEVSFDGLCSESHESSRGANTFALACQAVDAAKHAGVPRIGIVWTVHNANLHELSRLPDFLEALGVWECYISMFRKTGLLGSQAPFEPIDKDSAERIRGMLKHWEASRSHLVIAFPEQCSCGRTSVVIGHDGDVRLCPFLCQGIGNIYRTTLSSLWHDLEGKVSANGPLGYCAQLTGVYSDA